MNYLGITKDKAIFKGFYKGKIHISKIYNTKKDFDFHSSNIFLSFHDLSTGEIMQTKTLKNYITPSQTTFNKVDIHFIFKANGYYMIEFHGLNHDDEIGFGTSF